MSENREIKGKENKCLVTRDPGWTLAELSKNIYLSSRGKHISMEVNLEIGNCGIYKGFICFSVIIK